MKLMYQSITFSVLFSKSMLWNKIYFLFPIVLWPKKLHKHLIKKVVMFGSRSGRSETTLWGNFSTVQNLFLMGIVNVTKNCLNSFHASMLSKWWTFSEYAIVILFCLILLSKHVDILSKHGQNAPLANC